MSDHDLTVKPSVPTTDELGLTLYKKDGLELFISPDGSVFASGRAIGRMIDKADVYIYRYANALRKTATTANILKAKILTETGFKTATLFDESFILSIIKKYKPDLLDAAQRAAIRLYLHGLVGISYKPVAIQQPLQTKLPTRLELAKQLVEAYEIVESLEATVKNQQAELAIYNDKDAFFAVNTAAMKGLQIIVADMESRKLGLTLGGYMGIGHYLYSIGRGYVSNGQRGSIGRAIASIYRTLYLEEPKREMTKFYTPDGELRMGKVCVYPTEYLKVIDTYLRTVDLYNIE